MAAPRAQLTSVCSVDHKGHGTSATPPPTPPRMAAVPTPRPVAVPHLRGNAVRTIASSRGTRALRLSLRSPPLVVAGVLVRCFALLLHPRLTRLCGGSSSTTGPSLRASLRMLRRRAWSSPRPPRRPTSSLSWATIVSSGGRGPGAPLFDTIVSLPPMWRAWPLLLLLRSSLCPEMLWLPLAVMRPGRPSRRLGRLADSSVRALVFHPCCPGPRRPRLASLCVLFPFFLLPACALGHCLC